MSGRKTIQITQLQFFELVLFPKFSLYIMKSRTGLSKRSSELWRNRTKRKTQEERR